MRFMLDQNQITCLPDNPAENFGLTDRLQKIKLTNHTLYFNQTPSILPRPNILALICLIVFYPYLKSSSRIIFPHPVDPSFQEIMKLHQLTTNINLTTDSSDISNHDSNRIALAWGGGLDSWAALTLQSDFYSVLIHEEEPESPLPHSVKYLLNNLKIVRTNQKTISSFADQKNQQSPGWTTWVGVLVTSLWLSAEYQLTHLALGGNLGSTFLNNGKKYFPTHLRPSRWYRTFELINLPIYIPLAGLTDLGVIKILGSQIDHLKYCWFADQNGNNCHQCSKCIRKEILMGKNRHSVDQNFEGPSFEYIRTKDPQLGCWVEKYYQPALQLIPKSIDQRQLIEALSQKEVELLPPDENYHVEHYGFGF